MRILAIDWGTVRVGLAISDPDGKIAFPLSQPAQAATAIEEIKKIADENQVEKIIIGIPYSLDGKENESTAKTRAFLKKLNESVPIPKEVLDERFSSVAAEKLLIDSSQKEQRQIKDNVAAQQMLQSYLDNKINK